MAENRLGNRKPLGRLAETRLFEFQIAEYRLAEAAFSRKLFDGICRLAKCQISRISHLAGCRIQNRRFQMAENHLAEFLNLENRLTDSHMPERRGYCSLKTMRSVV